MQKVSARIIRRVLMSSVQVAPLDHMWYSHGTAKLSKLVLSHLFMAARIKKELHSWCSGPTKGGTSSNMSATQDSQQTWKWTIPGL